MEASPRSLVYIEIGLKMPADRFVLRDPRTIARDIPGVLDAIFPQMNLGLVNALNRSAMAVGSVRPVTEYILSLCSINHAALFEISLVRAEKMLKGNYDPDLEDCVDAAVMRQKRYYAAKKPVGINLYYRYAIRQNAKNLCIMIRQLREKLPGTALTIAPPIPGMSWISSGHADFAIAGNLIEVKHSAAQFSIADFRQVLMYWILCYSSAIDKQSSEYTDCVLLNPRRNKAVAFNFASLVRFASAGLGAVEVINIFQSLLGDQRLKEDSRRRFD